MAFFSYSSASFQCQMKAVGPKKIYWNGLLGSGLNPRRCLLPKENGLVMYRSSINAKAAKKSDTLIGAAKWVGIILLNC